ncbi:MAG: FG-GAP-like repeat-containing protein [Candidatus Bipolaricaulia bacterium]
MHKWRHVSRLFVLALILGLALELLTGCVFLRIIFFGEICKASGAGFTLFPSLGPPPLTVEFEGYPGCGRTALSYEWDFGDGTRASGQRARHTYTQLEQYHVTMTVRFIGYAGKGPAGEESPAAFVAVTDHVGFLTKLPLEEHPAAVADFTGDGILDLFSSCHRQLPQDKLVFYLYEGHGDGSFSKKLAWSSDSLIGLGTRSGLVADFNEDGWLDILPFNRHGGWSSPELFVLLNQGDGTFKTAPPWSFEEQTTLKWVDIEEVTLGDFDGDGHLDLAALISHYERREGLFIIWGRGDGSFSGSLQLLDSSYGEGPGGFPWTNLAAADFDNDGIDDLALTEERYGQAWGTGPTWSGVLLFPGRRDRQLEQAEALELDPPVVVSGLLAADLNLDGLVDLAIAEIEIPGFNSDLEVFSNCGGGQLQRDKRYLILEGQNPYYQPQIGDFDGDGWLDLLLVGGPAAIVFNDGGGLAEPLIFSPGADEAGDFNNDGYTDLIDDETLLLNSGSGSGP